MSASIRKLSQHSRSISLPSKSAPLKHQVEEHLCRLRLLELAASSSSSSSICRNLSGLQDLYDCVEDLLQSSLAKKSISHRDKKSLDRMLDATLKVLDFCGTTREILSEMKQSLQDLQSCVRRGGAESYVRYEVRSYMTSRKNGSKLIRKCLSDMKKMEVKFARHGNCDIVTVLRDVGSIALAVFESLLSFISGTKTRSKGSNWSLVVSKLLPSRGLACHGVDQDGSEVLKAHAALNALVGNTTSKELDVIRYIKEPLEALELSIQGIEEGLESLFRCLIKTRVSLLNILNQY